MAADERTVRIEERMARVEQRITNHGEELDALKIRIEGPPRDDSLAGRLHKVENDAVAANAARAALEAVQMIRDQREDRRWSRGDKAIAALVGAAIAIGPWLQPLIFHAKT